MKLRNIILHWPFPSAVYFSKLLLHVKSAQNGHDILFWQFEFAVCCSPAHFVTDRLQRIFLPGYFSPQMVQKRLSILIYMRQPTSVMKKANGVRYGEHGRQKMEHFAATCKSVIFYPATRGKESGQ